MEKFKSEGFYLLDLSELPLSFLHESLESQLPVLMEKIKHNVGNETKIILVKSNVYDIVFPRLHHDGLHNVVNVRIPFPGQGGQIKFQIEFAKALKLAGYSSKSPR